MKKKIIISVSVFLLIAALITGWVFWKMSRNPDKNADNPVVKTEYISDDGFKFTYSDETKTLTVYGKEIDNTGGLFGGESGFDYWFENAEKIVFAEGVTKSNYLFEEFKDIKTVEICASMQSFGIFDFPSLEKFVVAQGCEKYFSDENGLLYSVSHSASDPEETYIYLMEIPMNAPITEFTVPDYVDEVECTCLQNSNYIKKVIIDKDFDGKLAGGMFSVSGIEFFEVDAENQCYCSDEQGVLYSKDKSLICGIPSTLEELVMPENSRFAYSDDDNKNDKIKKITISNVAYSLDYYYRTFSDVEEFVVPQNNTYYCGVDGVVFSKDMSVIEFYPQKKPEQTYEIPSTVVTVDYNCFTDNQELQNLIIPDSVTTVCRLAFRNMEALETVKIGKGLKTFEIVDPMYTRFEYENPFDTCDNLKSVTVDKDNPYFCSDDQGALYTKDMKFLMTVPAGSESKVFTVPDAVKETTYAFTNCDELEVINIGSGLESIFIYLTVDAYDFYGFEYCASLREINVSEDNPYFKSTNGILYSKDGKTLVMYPPSKKGNTFVVPEYVTEIGWKAFRLNKYIEKLYVGKNVDSLENYFGSFPYFANDDRQRMMFDVYYEGEMNRTMEPNKTEEYSVYYNSTMPQ